MKKRKMCLESSLKDVPGIEFKADDAIPPVHNHVSGAHGDDDEVEYENDADQE